MFLFLITYAGFEDIPAPASGRRQAFFTEVVYPRPKGKQSSGGKNRPGIVGKRRRVIMKGRFQIMATTCGDPNDASFPFPLFADLPAGGIRLREL
jgi:hypothetical protein